MSRLCSNTTRHRVGGANNKRQAQRPSAVSGMLASPSPRFPPHCGRARSYTIFSTDAPKVPTPAIVNSVVYSLVLFAGGGSRAGPPFPYHSQLDRWPERLGRTGNPGRGNSVWHPSHS
ncbi:hypothetical protein HaLaN_05808, partial [Haematococcus lacustris]